MRDAVSCKDSKTETVYSLYQFKKGGEKWLISLMWKFLTTAP